MRDRVGPTGCRLAGGLPKAASAEPPRTIREGAAAVYLPACINRIFGQARDVDEDLSVPEALVAVSVRAGMPLWIPDDVGGHCCGTPWSSKGYSDGHAHMAHKMADSLWRWSDDGRLPVVIDATSCTLGSSTRFRPSSPTMRRASSSGS